MIKPLSYRFLAALTLALLPIGLIAALLSIHSFRSNRAEALVRVEARGEALAREIDDIVSDHGLVLRALAVQGTDQMASTGLICDGELTRFAEFDPLFASLYRVDGQGNILCASQQGPRLSDSDAARVLNITRESNARDNAIFFDQDRRNIIFAVQARPSVRLSDSVVAMMPVDAFRNELSDIVRPAGSRLTVQVAKLDAVEEDLPAPGFVDGNRYQLMTPTRLGGLSVRYDEELEPLGWQAIAAIASPPFMWIAALVISWLTLRRFVVHPLANMESGIRKRRAGEAGIRLRKYSGDTAELASFADAFDELSEKQTADRLEREQALAAQERLVREVHHRVKNNLQIIASLISIKARDTDDAGQQRAYGAIQMRVTALSHVHRWLYADDISRGVDLSALMTDLTSGLESSIESVEGVETNLTTKLESLYVGQDAAVPLSFLVTEIMAATGSRLAPGSALSAALTLSVDSGDRNKGCLLMESAAFAGHDPFASGQPGASARIVQGMVRQLRGTLSYDPERGRYTLNFPLDVKD